MWAAAPSQDERAVGEIGGERQRLGLERLLVDDPRLRVVDGQQRGRDHLLAAVAPRARHAHEAGRPLASARVALVVGAERDRRVRLAVGHFARKRDTSRAYPRYLRTSAGRSRKRVSR